MDIKSLSDEELIKQYKLARMRFIKVEEGNPEENEIQKAYDELFKEVNYRDLDLRKYK